jgi:hypothetical protein
MEKKSFGGLPVDLIFDAEQQLGIAFHARNVDAAKKVAALGESTGVMKRLAKEATDLVACASSAGKTFAVVANECNAVALQLESVAQTDQGELATVGIYGLPQNAQVEVVADDLARLLIWNLSDPSNVHAILVGIVELWTSVPNPSVDLPVGRTAPIEELDDGDYICVQFVGLSAGEAPFMLFIEAANDIARLMAASSKAA